MSGPRRLNFEAMGRLAGLADFTAAFAIRAVCKLGVSDALADGPRSIEEIATEVEAHAPSLLRAMRALVLRGLFIEPEPSRFALNPMAELMRSDHPLSMRHAFRLAPDVDALTEMIHTLRTGEAAFDHVFGEDYFAYLSNRPDLLDEFKASQSALTRLEQVVLLRTYDWSGVQQVVDIGGNDGTFLCHLLAANPRMHGTLFDLPETVATAPSVLAGFGVQDRCSIVAGNFFEAALPRGADVYIIKRVLVGLDDAQARTLFAAVRGAMAADGRLIIAEPMMSEGDVSSAMDLLMLVLGPGRVRTAREFEHLLAAESLRLTRGVATPMFPFIEARPTKVGQASREDMQGALSG
jgi:O-methyltransferase domain